jgi:hypothetical protein
MNHRRLAIIFLIIGMLVSPLVTPLLRRSEAVSEAAILDGEDLTGPWGGNDGGVYYVRQIGNAVWWMGLDGADGKNFSNVFHGTRVGNLITGEWSDVPRGGAASSGSLAIEVVQTPRGVALRKREGTGGFGGTTWFRTKQRPTPAPSEPPASNQRKILDDGTVEIREADGTVRKYHPDGSITMIFPDGRTQRAIPMQIRVATPPLGLLSESNLKPWLEAHNKNLFSIIQSLVTSAEQDRSMRALTNAESGKSLYEQIDFRTGAIEKLRGH